MTTPSTLTLRYDANGALGSVSCNSSSVTVSGAPSGTYLVVQSDSGAWAKAVSGNVTLLAGEIDSSLTSLEYCDVWLETTDTTERITTATRAVEAAGNYTATAGAGTLTPAVGVDDAITLTVKDSLGNTDTNFDGAKNVTITGVEAAPGGTYGSFNGTALDASSAGAGQVISVTFTDGVAMANLKLNKADAQTIGFSIATATTSATNTLTITPTHGAAVSMAVTQDITAPASNGGNFAQQPRITIKDAYGNTCTGDNTTVVTAAKEDAGTWTLTGTKTAMVSSGVATFTNLRATNTTLVNNAQLGFTATGLTKLTSTTVTLPAPADNAIAITKNSSTIYYPTLSDALEAVVNGDTITLLADITESASNAKPTAGITVTINGGGFTVTAPDESTESIALSLSGTGTVILKDLTLQGGSSTGSSAGLRAGGTLDIRSFGTVTVKGGAANISYGLLNYSIGTVDVTTASASGTTMGVGVANSGPGTVNVSTAEGGGAQGIGVANTSTGTINVTTAIGSLCGVNNQTTGTVNVTTATGSSYGVYNTGRGAINVTAATGSSGDAVSNSSGGTVNAGTLTGTVTGTSNTDVAAVTLHAGAGASCVLDSITIANSGTTQIGTLPDVYKADTCSTEWFTGAALTERFATTYVIPGETAALYSSFYTIETDSIPPTVTSVTPSVTGAAINGNIAITFSEPMNTVNGAVYLSSDGGGSYGSALTGGSWSAGNFVYTIPYSGLFYNKTYSIKTEGFKDIAGNVMSVDTNHSFTTKTNPSAATYAVNIGVVTGGSITATKTTAAEADIINLTIIPDSGKRLKAGTLKYNDGTDHAITGTSFTMPAADVTVSAEFEEIPSTVTNAEKVAADKAILDIYYATGDDATSVTQNLNLTVTGAVYGSTITWVSDNTDIISDTGMVTRPAYASGDANVTVTASIYNDGVSDSKSFSLKVLKRAVPTFTVTFDPAGGTRTGGGELTQTVTQGSAATAPMVERSRYTFSGWNREFNNVTSNLTVQANWIYNGSGDNNSGGGGGSYTPPTLPASNVVTEKQPNMPTTAKMSVPGTVKDGVLSATITEQMAKDAIKAAQDAAKKSGKEVDGIALDFNVTGSGSQDAWPSSAGTARPGYTNLNATIDAGAIDRLKEAGVKFVKIGSAVLDITLDAGAIAEIDNQSTGVVTVSGKMQTKLSKAAKKLIGNRPVFDITVSYEKNGKQDAWPSSAGTERPGTENVTNFGKGAVMLGIAYKAADNENTGNLFGVYVDKNGKPQLLTNSSYDNGRVMFSRNSLSTYGVGYKAPAPAFTDTAKHWAKDNIDFVASRGLISGTSATTFAPDTAITRADFLMALGRLSGANEIIYKTSSFTDVKASDTAMPYIEWATESKIVSGYGNGNFGPTDPITREQMAVMMQNYAKATGYQLPVSVAAVTFSDSAKISAYAKEAVKAIQQAGIMQGKGSNTLDPQGNATRAEASTILRRFVELVIDEGTARGWVQNDAGQWQYIGENGNAVTGWFSVETAKYYFTSDGIMVSGNWLEIDGKWYYFYADGALAKNAKVGGYEVDENGVRRTK